MPDTKEYFLYSEDMEMFYYLIDVVVTWMYVFVN